jgi:hypothetical protein
MLLLYAEFSCSFAKLAKIAQRLLSKRHDKQKWQLGAVHTICRITLAAPGLLGLPG